MAGPVTCNSLLCSFFFVTLTRISPPLAMVVTVFHMFLFHTYRSCSSLIVLASQSTWCLVSRPVTQTKCRSFDGG
jgi:hypothetical protein